FPQFSYSRSPRTRGDPGVPCVIAPRGGFAGNAETRRSLELSGKNAKPSVRKLRKVQGVGRRGLWWRGRRESPAYAPYQRGRRDRRLGKFGRSWSVLASSRLLRPGGVAGTFSRLAWLSGSRPASCYPAWGTLLLARSAIRSVDDPVDGVRVDGPVHQDT